MNDSAFRAVVLFCTLSLTAGCGASIELQRSDVALESMFPSSTFYLRVHDGSKSSPDNWDGHLNLLWTNGEKRDAVVAEHLESLLTGLKNHSFQFVETRAEGTVCVDLRFKSVRFDPIGGWVTDDANIDYVDLASGKLLGTVIADEIWITPTIKMVFKALLDGSLELWGVGPEE